MNQSTITPRANKNKNLTKIIGLGVIVIILFIGFSSIRKDDSVVEGVASEPEKIVGPIATTNVNEEILIPLSQDEENTQNLRFSVETAEKRKEILVKGNKATAVEGRMFLILNVKIINEIDNGLDISTRDYVRLAVNGDTSEWYAPDIHNDPVEVQAISTKFTRLGFPINESDQNLLLQLGEISGEKKIVEVNFN